MQKVLQYCLAVPENGFNFLSQKFEKKNWKMTFSNAESIRFWAQVGFERLF